MTSEGSYSLILPFTSKTGQSGQQNRQKVLLTKTKNILAFYKPNFSGPDMVYGMAWRASHGIWYGLERYVMVCESYRITCIRALPWAI